VQNIRIFKRKEKQSRSGAGLELDRRKLRYLEDFKNLPEKKRICLICPQRALETSRMCRDEVKQKRS
jgi:hypothetical protein